MTIEAGRVLSGRYRLVKPLGQGAQGAVWIADHLALTTQVAVKLIDPELAKQSDALERFKREATAAAQLRSAHIIQILDHGVDDAQPFIVMELLEGEDLFERIEKRRRLSLKEMSKIVTQVARALTRAHAAGIVHRDLKPENVFLVPNDDDEVAKVLDFGVAKVSDPAKRTMQRTGVGTLIGTPHYMSPEQVKGVSEVDYRTDIWALGIITYQCVTGQLPFDSEGVGDLLIRITIGDLPVPSKIVPTLPATFDAWFAKICDRDPLKRFDTAREAADALAKAAGLGTERAAGVQGPDSDPSSAPSPAKKPASLGSAKRIAPVLDAADLAAASNPARVAKSLSPPPREMLESHDVEFELGESVRPPPAPPSVAPPRPVHAEARRAPPSSTVSGLASSGLNSLPPPELDGSRRRRAVWFVGLIFVAAAGGVAWFTIRPNLSFGTGSAAPAPSSRDTGSTVLAVPTAVQIGEPASAPIGSAVDPGAHRTSPATLPVKPSSNGGRHGGKAKAQGSSDEPSIVVPDPDDKAPEPKSPRGGPPPAPDDPPSAP